ncbi:unnamed protein product [Ambrosiozyma monospora]|uniref:Unnamed protein product n=1 Tax=Ambrosiozyma monospora TaxID=43982 RepID=A0A9W6YL41_AMBMO|nr:unnamed protein product [Ambrosiozyma monospora]
MLLSQTRLIRTVSVPFRPQNGISFYFNGSGFLPIVTPRQSRSLITHSRNKAGILDFDLVQPDLNTQPKHTSTTASSDITTTTQLKYQIPPIIFLHGLMGNRKNNRTAARELSKLLGTSVIVPDLRNHGTSFHLAPHDNESMCNDLILLINHLRNDDDALVAPQIKSNSTNNESTTIDDSGFIVIGHSMGGKVAMCFALRNPELVKGVISIDNIPYTNPERSFAEFEKFHIWLNELQWLTEGGGFKGSMAGLRANLKKVVDSEAILNFLLSNFDKSSGIAAGSGGGSTIVPKVPLKLINSSIENLIDFKLSTRGDLDKYAPFNDPLLIVRARYSEFIGRDLHASIIDKRFTSWEIEDVDSGHWIISEKRKEFIHIASNWILKKFGNTVTTGN